MAFGSLFMAAGKRYAELRLHLETGAKIRKALEGYTPTYPRFVWTLAATVLVLCLVLGIQVALFGVLLLVAFVRLGRPAQPLPT